MFDDLKIFSGLIFPCENITDIFCMWVFSKTVCNGSMIKENNYLQSMDFLKYFLCNVF